MTSRYAFKLPRRTSWRSFLQGLLANMQEAEFATTGWPQLCPVLFSLPGGFLVVMPRVREMSEADWDAFDAGEFLDKPDYHVPAEYKRDSFGWLNGRIVAIDYGS